MSYETSYDIGARPFRPNKERGLWSSSSDFLYACICNAFRMDVIYGLASVPLITNGGIYVIIVLIFNMMLYSIPVIFIQSFMGQFSSSGFISAFRIAPVFKGLGYIGLAINLSSLAFYSIFAGVPLLFFFYSLQPTLPWSCEGTKTWLFNQTHCFLNHSEIEDDMYLFLSVPSVEFFIRHVQEGFSFGLFGCVLVVWVGVAFAVYNTTEKIGQIFRYSVFTLFTLLIIVFIRMIFLPGVKEGVDIRLSDPRIRWELLVFMTPMLIFSTFGPGWGTILSMSSYNKFKTNITKYSWLISLSQIGTLLLIGLVCMFTKSHLTQNKSNIFTPIFEMQWSLFLSIPSSLASMDYPHLWTWMFLAVLIIGSFNLVVVQMFSVLTALFDEFEQLREFRKELIFGTAGILALFSAFFCTEDGIFFIEVLADLSITTQSLMNFVLLIVVVWIYGRVRFQRDVEFMTSQIFATWKVYFVRFVTPLFVIFTLLVGIAMSMFSHSDIIHLLPIAGVLVCLPWIVLPGYVVFKLMQTNGTLRQRIQRCTRPTDWYPVDPEDRLRYEETVDNPEMSHPLTTIVL